MAELITELFTAAARERALDDAMLVHVAPLARAFNAAVIGLASWAATHPEESADLQALRLMNLTWTGLGSVLEEGELWLPEGR